MEKFIFKGIGDINYRSNVRDDVLYKINIRVYMNIYTVTEARSKLFQLVDETNIHHEPIYLL